MHIEPQPIGIYPGAAAHLLLRLPSSTQAADATHNAYRSALNELLRGNLECEVPDAWKFFVAAARGELIEARELLNKAWSSPSHGSECASDGQWGQSAPLEQWLAYNRFVLDPNAQLWPELQASLSDPVLSLLAEVVAYAYGIRDQLPASDSLTGELRAWHLATCAARQLEQGNFLAGRQLLVEAIDSARLSSPLLSAILLAQSSHLAEQNQLPAELVRAELQQAIDLAQSCPLPGFLADLYTQLGMLLQRVACDNRADLLAAVRAYQTALQSGVTAQSNPTAFAELQNNLGLAYLSMPPNDSSAQLRTGISIQSFKRALDCVDRDTHGELWARINMNLANALQYAPSSHPATNLLQAVEIYEQVLQVRSRARDPVAYALVILNQANALAHLGIFKPALEKAAEAYKLFQWYDQAEAAMAARDLVENVNARIDALQHTEHAETSDTTATPRASKNQQEMQHGHV